MSINFPADSYSEKFSLDLLEPNGEKRGVSFLVKRDGKDKHIISVSKEEIKEILMQCIPHRSLTSALRHICVEQRMGNLDNACYIVVNGLAFIMSRDMMKNFLATVIDLLEPE